MSHYTGGLGVGDSVEVLYLNYASETYADEVNLTTFTGLCFGGSWE